MNGVPRTMRAVRLHHPGGVDALKVEKVPVPRPGPGEALVRVEACGVNFIDIYKRTGLYKVPLPATLGEEGAGSVVAIGDGVLAASVGERVAWAGVFGSYAEYVVVPADRLVPILAEVSAVDAAAAMLQGMTAHYLATSTHPLQPGERCLVHAAAGGVGHLLVQIAKLRGARVIGTVGSEEKAVVAREAGADEVIIYTQQDFVAEVTRIAGERPLDAVFDSVGKPTFLKGLGLLRPRGTMVLFGQSGGQVDAFDPQVLAQNGSLFLTRPTLAHYTRSRDELLARAREIFAWIGAGDLRLRIDSEYPLDAVTDAHRALEGRRTKGKLILRP